MLPRLPQRFLRAVPDVSTPPRVSLLIASYNRARFIRRAVESCLHQSVHDLEVVVSDDHSRDGTAEVLRQIPDPRLRIHTQPANTGCWENWATVIRLARGQLSVCLGDDDHLPPDYLERLLATREAHPGMDVVFSPTTSFTAEGQQVRHLVPDLPTDRAASPAELMYGICAQNMSLPGALLSTELLASVWPETKPDDIVADVGFVMRLAARENVGAGTCNSTAYLKTVHSQQISERGVAVAEELFHTSSRILPTCRSFPIRRHAARFNAMLAVLLARHHAAHRDLPRCRALLRHATSVAPWVLAPWSQLVQAYLTPGRLRQSARTTSATA